MSTEVQTELERIESNVAAAYAAAEEQGADMPAAQNTENLAKTVSSIKTVKFTEQALDEAQQAQARTNIGAASQADLDQLSLEKVNVPAYWQAALDAGVEAINTALCTAGKNKSAFLFYTDAHWNYCSQMSPTLLKYLYNHTGMTKTFYGGDIVNNEGTDYDTMEYLWDWRKQLKDLPNHHSVPGNHDDGNATNNLFSEQYIYGYLLSAEETSDIVRGDSGMYYYIDNPSEKTRYLFLDTAYQGVGNDQKEFVKNALLTTPESWHIVAIAHIWLDTDYNVSPPVPAGINSNASILLSMFDSYNSRSGDYADCGGWVEFCIGGHTHWDYDSTTATGIPIILVETDSKHVRSGLGYTAGTTTEASVNGIIADYDAHKIHVVRIGRGNSRDVKVTSHVVKYTNMLDEAVDSNNQPFNGGKGWAPNSRIGSSTLESYIDKGTYFITGHIEVDRTKDICVRLKNVTFQGENNAMALYTSEFTRCTINVESGNNWFTATAIANNASFSPKVDGSNVIQFTIPEEQISNGDVAYIAFQTDYIGDDSIITINQEIPEESEYTNWLKLSTEDDGETIYNADDTPGYKTGCRINSSGVFKEGESAYAVTGFIPFFYGDVAYLSQDIFEGDPGSCNIVAYKRVDGVMTFISSEYFNNSYGSITTTESGNYKFEPTQLTTGISQWQNVEFIRISGVSTMSENSVITINEPIE